MAVFEHFLTLGQSLAVGSSGAPSISTVSEVSNAWVVAANGSALIPLKSSTAQLPYLTMGYRVAAANPSKAMGFSTHGLSGQSIAQLSKGGSSGKYEEAIARVAAAHAAQTALGHTYSVPWISWIQGEADQTFGTPRDVYRTRFLRLMADYAADIMAITGQANAPKWMVNQTASWAYYGTAASIGLELLSIAQEVAGVWVVGGQYQLPYADGLHLNRVGYYRVGELIGRAINAVNASGVWAPLIPLSVVATEDGIQVTYDRDVAVDTSVVAAQEDAGYSLSGSAASITGVSVDGAVVTLTTDVEVSEAAAYLGYGIASHDGGVGLGNVRDTDPSVSGYDGAPLANWAVHARIAVVPYGVPASVLRVTQWNYVSPGGLVPFSFELV